MKKLKQENAELKRMLRLAVDDLEYIGSWAKICRTCAHENNEGDLYCKKLCSYHWIYAAEAEKLLNGRGEENG